ncbi:MAG: YggT family protein [Clostridia bacterium]|nr:YggT family protein [Clostridia bacterium]
MLDTLIFFVKQTLLVALNVLSVAMMVRAIMSWFDQLEESRLSAFLYMLTEPVILPVRKLCQRLRLFEGLPLDIPFLITVILLYVLQVLLSA